MSAGLGFKDKRFLQTLEYIDDKYIEDVFDVLKEPNMAKTEYKKPSPFKHLKQYIAAAACILVLSLLIPVFGYVADIIGSIAAGTGSATSEITEAPLYEETETTAQEETTVEPAPNFQFSDVKIVADNNTSINPISVHIGYTWYKDEKSVWTEEIAGWSYVINIDKYKYENFPHLTVCDFISHTTPDNISLSSFMVYNTDWEKTVYSFDNVSDLRTLPAGDYIIVGIENLKIPFDKPHYMIGEYDYKSDKSAIIFGLTVLEEIEQTSTLSYLMFIPELEDVDENTMLDIKKAWKEYWYNDWYSIYYLMSSYTDQDAARLAAEHAQQKAEEAYTQLFNSEYFDSYGYLGTFGDIIVISAYSLIDNSQSTIDIPQPITDYYVYYEGKIYTHSGALITSIIFEDQIKLFIERNTKYLECINNYNFDQSE